MIRFWEGLSAIACLLLVAATATAAPTAITLDDLHRLAKVSSPVISPDGQTVVYVVTTPDLDRDAAQSDLYAVPLAGGAPRRLTDTPFHNEWAPVYRPGSGELTFLADLGDDDAKTQIWSFAEDGAEPTALTSREKGVSSFRWSPDGARIAFIARDPKPDPGKDSQGNKKPAPPLVTERFQFKQDGPTYLDHRRKRLRVLTIADGSEVALTDGFVDVSSPSWSPDGSRIAFLTKLPGDKAIFGGDPDAHSNYDVYTVATAPGGDFRKISTFEGNDGGGTPEWSPDGTRLLWLQSGTTEWGYFAPVQLAVGNLSTGEETQPAHDDRWVYQPQWSADGQAIYALIEESRTQNLARIDAASGTVTWLTTGERGVWSYASGAGNALVVAATDDKTPVELYRVEADGLVQLTDHNAFLRDRVLATVERVQVTSDGHEIHGLVTKPADYDPTRRYPLILRVHGGPVGQFAHAFAFDQQLYAANDYVVLGMNPRGSSGRGFDFARAIYGAWGGVDVDDVIAGVDHLIATGVADETRMAVTGWSYGGMMTDYVIASDDRFRAASSGAGTANMYGTWGHDQYIREYTYELGTPWGNREAFDRVSYPLLHADRIKTPTLFQCAALDMNVPCIGSEHMYQALKMLGIPTRLIVYPDQHHGLTIPSYKEERLRQILNWIDTHLETGETASGTAGADTRP